MGTLNVANVITDRITPTGGVPSSGGGGIIQIVEASTTSRLATSSSQYQASNMSCTITPKFSTSKIYVTLGGDANNNGSGYNMHLTYYRSIGGGSFSNIAPNGPSDTSNVDYNYGLCAVYGSGSRIHVPMAMPFLDSPATTSAVTYKVYIRALAGTVEYPVNNGYHAARMFLMEYSA